MRERNENIGGTRYWRENQVRGFVESASENFVEHRRREKEKFEVVVFIYYYERGELTA